MVNTYLLIGTLTFVIVSLIFVWARRNYPLRELTEAEIKQANKIFRNSKKLDTTMNILCFSLFFVGVIYFLKVESMMYSIQRLLDLLQINEQPL